MALFFIQESKEKNTLKFIIDRCLSKVYYEQKENNIFITLPIRENKKINARKVKRIANKLMRLDISKNLTNNVILSSYLIKLEVLKNELYKNKINVLNGKFLFKVLTEKIIRYICKTANKKIEKVEVSVLANDASNINKQLILDIAQKVKTLNVITQSINEFRNIEEYLYNEMGIVIKLSNNKKKDLLKSDIVINLDFTEQEINKYVFPNKCIIININGNVKIKTKSFNGINANNYVIYVPKKYKIEGFNSKIVYEGTIFDKDYNLAKKQTEIDRIRVLGLIGEKGIINRQEFYFINFSKFVEKNSSINYNE